MNLFVGELITPVTDGMDEAGQERPHPPRPGPRSAVWRETEPRRNLAKVTGASLADLGWKQGPFR